MVNLNQTPYPARTLSNGHTVRAGHVGLHLVHVDVNEATVNPQRMCSPQRVRRLTRQVGWTGLIYQMRELGLDGVAADYVEAEPVVIAFLNEHCSLHRAVCFLSQSRRLIIRKMIAQARLLI